MLLLVYRSHLVEMPVLKKLKLILSLLPLLLILLLPLRLLPLLPLPLILLLLTQPLLLSK